MSELSFALVLFALGVVSGSTAAVVGFGIGSLLTPLVVTRVEPQAAVGVVAIPHLLATVVRYFQHRAAVDRSVLLRFGLPSAVGGLVGAFFQARLTIDVARTPVYLARAAEELKAFAGAIGIAAAGCLLGTILGERLFLGLSPERYRVVISAAIVAVGAWVLWQAS